jgi:hypothetical protein
MDENIEQEEEIIIENIEDTDLLDKEKDESTTEKRNNIIDEELPSVVPSIKNVDEEVVTTRLTFNNMDTILDDNNYKKEVESTKSLERLEEISTSNAIQRKLEEEPDDDKIQIYQDQTFDLSDFDILDEVKTRKLSDDVLLDDIEVL